MIRASLIDFLNTGCFGPVKPGITVDEIVSLLGEPPDKNGKLEPHAFPPPYWQYENLNMAFCVEEGEAPYADFFTFDNIERLRGKWYKLARNMNLYIEYFNRYSRPSQFIRSIDNIDRVSVCLVDICLWPRVHLYVDDLVEVSFHHGDDEEIQPPKNMEGYIRKLDSEVKLSAFYSWDRRSRTDRRARAETWPGRYEPFMVSGREYLKAVDR